MKYHEKPHAERSYTACYHGADSDAMAIYHYANATVPLELSLESWVKVEDVVLIVCVRYAYGLCFYRRVQNVYNMSRDWYDMIWTCCIHICCRAYTIQMVICSLFVSPSLAADCPTRLNMCRLYLNMCRNTILPCAGAGIMRSQDKIHRHKHG